MKKEVTVMKCSYDTCWYVNHVGKSFELLEITASDFYVIYQGERHLIHGCDGKVIKERTNIESTLKERDKHYGEFAKQAKITRNLKRVMHTCPNWSALSDDKQEALDQIALKIGRILNGDPEYADSWHDIIGYAKLIEDALKDSLLFEDADDGLY